MPNRPRLSVRPSRAPLGAALAMALLVAAAWPGAASAQSAVKVLVNDQPVTSMEISNRLKFLKLVSSGKATEKQAMDELIDERLKLQEAKRRNTLVTSQEVEAAFAEMAGRNKMTADKLEAAMRQAGVNPQTLKDRLKAEMSWSDVVRARFRATVSISERDVSKALAANATTTAKPGEEGKKGGTASSTQTVSEFKVRQIIFVVPNKASAGYEAQRKREAEAFRARFGGCDGAVAQAKGVKDVVVKPLVRRDETALTGELGQRIVATPVGKTTPADRMDLGWELIAVCSKTTIEGKTKADDEARDSLMNERGKLMARRYLRDIRSEAVIEYR